MDLEHDDATGPRSAARQPAVPTPTSGRAAERVDRSEYGAVLRPDWAREMVRRRHPSDGSSVVTVTTVPCPDGALPILLLHGIGNSGAIYGPILSSVAPLGPVFAPTLSPPLLAKAGAAAGADRAAAVDDLVEWLTAIASPPWRLVGHSMGGLIAGLLVRGRPDLVDGAVMLNSPLPGVIRRIHDGDTFDRTGRALLALKALAQVTAFGRPRLPRFLRGPELIVVRNGLRGFVRDVGRLDDQVLARAITATRTSDAAEFLRIARRLPEWYLAPTDDVPVTILLGDSDPLVPPSDYDQVSAAYPGAVIHIADYCGHFVHLELPRLTIDIISDAFGAASPLTASA